MTGRAGTMRTAPLLLAWVLALACGASTASPLVDEAERVLRAGGVEAAAAYAAKAAALPAQTPERFALLLLRGLVLAGENHSDDAAAVARQLEGATLAGGRRWPLASAAASLVRARQLMRHHRVEDAERLLRSIDQGLSQQADGGFRLRLLTMRADVHASLGHFKESIDLMQQALLLADTAQPPWRRAQQRSNLAWVLHGARQPERALATSAQALQQARAAGDAMTLAEVLTVHYLILGALDRHAEQLAALQESLAWARTAGSRRVEINGLSNMADYYLGRGDHQSALDAASRALPMARDLGNNGIESVALTNIGLAQIALGRREAGVEAVRQAMLIEERAGAVPAQAEIQHLLGTYLEQAGHLGEAWAAFAKRRRLADEVFRRDHESALLELQESFDSQRLQRELAEQGSQAALQQAQLQAHLLQQRTWALMGVAGALLVALLVLLMRRVRRANAELQRNNLTLQRVSQSDPLTGLANRRHFQAVMNDSAGQALQSSLLLIDIDHFKRINDRHGHAVGDAVLVEVAARLVASLREDDLTVRWGGEEFLVMARGLAPPQVEALAERLLCTIGGKPVQAAGHWVDVTASIGFASFPLPPAHRALPWERAIDLVDKALYLAKAHGRNRAYGLRSMADEGALGTLEDAWKSGRADLKLLPGPAETVA